MARRKRFFKFKLTRKQKKRLVAFLAIGLFIGVGLWLYTSYTQYRLHRPIPDTRKPKIVFVIDDIGADNKLTKQLQKLGSKVTYAILPLRPYSKYYASLSLQTGANVILHLPLDTNNNVIPGPGLIVNTMPAEAVIELLGRDLDSVPHHIGVNNHCGSRSTADERLMTIILKELKRRRLFFLDSYTTRDSVVPYVAKKVGIPFLQRGVFLDNSNEKSSIRSEIKRLENVARKKGSAVAIGHYRKNTLEVLAREIPRLEAQGFEIISLREMVKSHRD